jgi:CRP-like cAMP-binding protein
MPPPAPTPSDKRKLFQGHALFGELPAQDLDALLLHARVERYPTGSKIFAKGSPGRSMMAILKGRVRISVPSPAGPDAVLTILRAGEIFGEIALLDGEDRTADTAAIDDCELLVLDYRDFVPFLRQRADLCVLLLRLLCQRLRRTNQQVGDVRTARQPHRQRVDPVGT